MSGTAGYAEGFVGVRKLIKATWNIFPMISI
jgi:hypothetical protein